MSLTWTRGGTGPLQPASTGGPVLAPAGTTAPSGATVAGRERAGELLVDLYGYLSAHAESHPALASAVALLKAAVAEHRSETSPDPLAGVRRVALEIQRLRQTDPSIPDS